MKSGTHTSLDNKCLCSFSSNNDLSLITGMDVTDLILLWDEDVIDDGDLVLLLHEDPEPPSHQKYNRFTVDNFACEEFRKFF